MAGPEELDIEISASGEVKVHVKGRPGKACLDYVDVFRKVLGEIKDQKLTPEYYEAETRVDVQQHVKRG